MNRRELIAALVGLSSSTLPPPSQPEPQKIVLEMDGRKLAELVVPHIPDVICRYGLK